jgi:integrase
VTAFVDEFTDGPDETVRVATHAVGGRAAVERRRARWPVPASSVGYLVTPATAVGGFSQRTVDRRTWTLLRWLRHLGPVRLADATAVDVERFLAAIPSATSRATPCARTSGSSTAGRAGAACSTPTAETDPPWLPRRLPTPVAAADVQRIIEATRGVDRLAIVLAAYAGLRVSEIEALRGEDVDLERRVLTVRDGKGGVDGRVPIAEALADELARWPRTGRLLGRSGRRGRRARRRAAASSSRRGSAGCCAATVSTLARTTCARRSHGVRRRQRRERRADCTVDASPRHGDDDALHPARQRRPGCRALAVYFRADRCPCRSYYCALPWAGVGRRSALWC